MFRITSANEQQLCLQRVDVVDHLRVWSPGRNRRYVTLSGCRRRHTFHCLVRPHIFRHVPQWPCPVRKRFSNDHWRREVGNQEVGLWDRLPMRRCLNTVDILNRSFHITYINVWGSSACVGPTVEASLGSTKAGTDQNQIEHRRNC